MSEKFAISTSFAKAVGGYRGIVSIVNTYSDDETVVWESEVFTDLTDESGRITTHAYTRADEAATAQVRAKLLSLFAA